MKNQSHMKKTFYKVLDEKGHSCHGGTLEWSLPEGKKPGKWHKVAGPIVKCKSGIHLTTDPVKWPHAKMRIFLAEVVDDVTEPDSDAKVVTSAARLLRELTDEECAVLRVFRSGLHEVKDGTCIALGSATVTALGSATVAAYDSATVTALGSATVRALGSATVTAYDSATVTASGSATVRAYDSATVTALGSATVISHYGSPTIHLEGKAIFVDHRND